MHKSIFIVGFRGTGKTTIGRTIAKKINWQFIDIDKLIEQKEGVTINQLTEGGTNWQKFRQIEEDTLLELLEMENIVVSVGGGTTVNNIIKERTKNTFGKINTNHLKKTKKTLIVLLYASEETIAQRIKRKEQSKIETTRPILNENKAKEVNTMLKQHEHNNDKQKEIIIEEIVKDSMETYEIRKPLYSELTNNTIDTGENNIEESCNAILKLLS